MCLYPLLLSFSLFLARRSLRLPSRPPRERLSSPLPRFLLSPVPFPFSPPRGLPRHFLVNYGRRTGEGRGVSARAPGPSSNPLPPRRYPRRTTWGTLNASAGSPWRHPLPAPPFSCSTSSSSSPSSSSAPSRARSRARGCLAPPSPVFPYNLPGSRASSFFLSFLFSPLYSIFVSPFHPAAATLFHPVPFFRPSLLVLLHLPRCVSLFLSASVTAAASVAASRPPSAQCAYLFLFVFVPAMNPRAGRGARGSSGAPPP